MQTPYGRRDGEERQYAEDRYEQNKQAREQKGPEEIRCVAEEYICKEIDERHQEEETDDRHDGLAAEKYADAERIVAAREPARSGENGRQGKTFVRSGGFLCLSRASLLCGSSFTDELRRSVLLPCPIITCQRVGAVDVRAPRSLREEQIDRQSEIDKRNEIHQGEVPRQIEIVQAPYHQCIGRNEKRQQGERHDSRQGVPQQYQMVHAQMRHLHVPTEHDRRDRDEHRKADDAAGDPEREHAL